MRTTRSRAVSGDSDDDDAPQTFMFQGKAYESYQEMVNAKRQRNQDVLASSGLLGAKAAIDDAVLEQKAAKAASRGLKRSKAPREPLPRRKSSRLQGVAASGIYVESELAAGKVVVAGGLYTPNDSEEESKFFNDRINDGSDLTVSEAVELCGSKWSKEGTVEAAEQFMKQSLSDITKTFSSTSSRKGSPDSVRNVPGKSITSKTLQSNLNALSLESDTCVAKVTPERIYSVACNPNPNHIIACAGDKRGHVGIWNVDQYGAEAKQEDESSSDGVHLFKPFNGAV